MFYEKSIPQQEKKKMDKQRKNMYNSAIGKKKEKRERRMVFLAMEGRRKVCECNVNYSPEGIFHPDRVMEVYDLLYLTEGSWEIWEEENRCFLQKGQVLLLEPGLHHYSRKKCTPGMRNIYIHFERMEGDGSGRGEGIAVPKITDCTGSREVPRLFEQMAQTFWSGGVNKEKKMTALLELLLCELAAEEMDKTVSRDPLIREILQRFYAVPERFFSPGELAEQYGYSVRTLSGRFKKYTGKSIHQYQMQLKLDMARSQIRQDQARGLKDIARSFGFYDEFQFSRLFKRQFGCPPCACRTGADLK